MLQEGYESGTRLRSKIDLTLRHSWTVRRRKLMPDQAEIIAICINRYSAIWPYRFVGMEKFCRDVLVLKMLQQIVGCLPAELCLPWSFGALVSHHLAPAPWHSAWLFVKKLQWFSWLWFSAVQAAVASRVLLMARGAVALGHSLPMRSFFLLNNSNNGMGLQREKIPTFSMTSSGNSKALKKML